jgi:hypothetical protein
MLLAAMGADETQIGASFCEAVRIAREQKFVLLEKRAEATFAEYRRHKHVSGTWIPTATLVTARSALSLGLLWEVQRYQTNA